MKWIEVEMPCSLLWTEPGLGAGKLSGVTGVLKVADSDETEDVGEGAWTRVTDGAGCIPDFLHPVLRGTGPGGLA